MTMDLYNLSEDLAYLVYKVDESIQKAEQALASDASSKKLAQPVIDELQTLKETLVITEGNNYVDSAEPQLREKLATLYSKVASAFDKPGASELANMKLLKGKYEEAVSQFEEVEKKRISKLNKYLEKNGKARIEFKSRDEYLETAT
jgi:ATP/maltotriose-dependent transcriptional regulator MalT